MNVRVFALAVLASVVPGVASAQVVRHATPATRQVRAGALRAPAAAQGPRTLRIGPHTYYGTIASIAGTTIVLRTRHERLVKVDAADVLAAGTYSMPLFVGKLVAIDGTGAANGVFTAAHIFRMTNLASLPDDH